MGTNLIKLVLSPRIEAHMLSYVKLQLSTLDQDKKRLSKAFNAGKCFFLIISL
ncbi:MAG: hypothetical protein ACI9VT_001090 [Psychroserpens sp.]|jgi:hypothetical protein